MTSSGGNTSGTSVRNYIPMANKYDRIVLLVDMDCFYCQVEEKLNPALRGQPLAVVQYNAWRGGGIIAVNYAARAKGVTRHMRGDEAKLHCPDIVLAKVPSVREKADLTKYRDAGKEVANVLQRFTKLLERASVDEAYLDITDKVNERLEAMSTGAYVLQPEKLLNTYAVGYEDFGDYVNRITARFINPNSDDDDENFLNVYDVSNMAAVRQSDLRLLLGASIAGDIRAAVKQETGYECSAGIAHNKILAKLACGVNKPNKQTLLPLNQISMLFDTLPVRKITGLGGKFGEDVCERLKIEKLGQLVHFSKEELQKRFDEKNGNWLYNICRGIDLEAVTPRFYSKSIGCCKKFPGRNSIQNINTLNHWLNELAKEICDRLEKDIEENNRRARQMVVSYVQNIDGEEIASSRSGPLLNYDSETIVRCGLDLIKSNTKQFLHVSNKNMLNNEILFLGFSVGKFETIKSGQCKLQKMFANQMSKNKQTTECSENLIETAKSDAIQDKQLQNNSNKDCSIKSHFLKKIEKDICETSSQTSHETESHTTNRDILEKDVVKQPKSQVAINKSKSFFHNTLLKQQISVVKSAPSEDLQIEALDDQKNSNETKLNEQLPQEIDQNIAIDSPFDHVQTQNDQPNMLVADQQQQQQQLPIDSNSRHAAMKRKYSTFEESEIVTPLPLQDYETSYAEYAIPDFRPELLQYVECNVCHANIPADERTQQTHQDEHFAQQLSQKQRLEYREEIMSKVTQNKLPTRKIVKKTKTTPFKTSDITKFLKHKTTLADECSVTTNDEMIICEICNEAIEKMNLQEHNDYHMAKKLHKELNQTQGIVSKGNNVTVQPSHTQTQKNLNISTGSKSIANYFLSQPKA